MRLYFPRSLKPGRADRAAVARIASLVDTDFYIRTNPDVREAGMDAALHYTRYGWREGRDPSPDFSTEGYLAKHPHLIGGKINPLEHFARNSDQADTPQNLKEVMEVVAKEFDTEFYAQKYADTLPQNKDLNSP